MCVHESTFYNSFWKKPNLKMRGKKIIRTVCKMVNMNTVQTNTYFPSGTHILPQDCTITHCYRPSCFLFITKRIQARGFTTLSIRPVESPGRTKIYGSEYQGRSHQAEQSHTAPNTRGRSHQAEQATTSHIASHQYKYRELSNTRESWCYVQFSYSE